MKHKFKKKYPDGGKVSNTKTYTDPKEFKKAEQAYSDSLDTYNSYLKSLEQLKKIGNVIHTDDVDYNEYMKYDATYNKELYNNKDIRKIALEAKRPLNINMYDQWTQQKYYTQGDVIVDKDTNLKFKKPKENEFFTYDISHRNINPIGLDKVYLDPVIDEGGNVIKKRTVLKDNNGNIIKDSGYTNENINIERKVLENNPIQIERYKEPVIKPVLEERNLRPNIDNIQSKRYSNPSEDMNIVGSVEALTPSRMSEQTPDGHYRTTRVSPHAEPTKQVWLQGEKWKDVSPEEFDKINSEKYLTEYKYGGNMKNKFKKKYSQGGNYDAIYSGIDVAGLAIGVPGLGQIAKGVDQGQDLVTNFTNDIMIKNTGWDEQEAAIAFKNQNKFGDIPLIGNNIGGTADLFNMATGKTDERIDNYRKNRFEKNSQFLEDANRFSGYAQDANVTFAMGGNMNQDFSEFKGPNHENGGVTISPEAEVEGGETKKGDYIFSDRLNIPGKKRTFAQMSKEIKKRYTGKRPNDEISIKAEERELATLQDQQEIIRGEIMSNAYVKAYGGFMKKNKKKFAFGGPDNDPKKLKAEGYIEHSDYFYNPRTGMYVDKPSDYPQFDAQYQKNIERFFQPGVKFDDSSIKPMLNLLANTGIEQMPINTGSMTYDKSKGIKNPGMEDMIGPESYLPGTLYNTPNTNSYGSGYDLMYSDPNSFNFSLDQYPILDKKNNIQTTPEDFSRLQPVSGEYSEKLRLNNFNNQYSKIQNTRDKVRKAYESNFGKPVDNSKSITPIQSKGFKGFNSNIPDLGITSNNESFDKFKPSYIAPEDLGEDIIEPNYNKSYTPSDADLGIVDDTKYFDDKTIKSLNNYKASGQSDASAPNAFGMQTEDYISAGVQSLSGLSQLYYGLKGPDEVRDAKFNLVRPNKVNYTPAKRLAAQEADEAFNGLDYDIRNNASSAGNYLSNRLASGIKRVRTKAKQIAEMSMNEENTNAQIMNSTNAANANILNQEEQINIGQEDKRIQEKDAARMAVTEGLNNVGQSFGTAVTDKRKYDWQKLSKDYINQQNFVFDNQGNRYFKKKDGTLVPAPN